VFFFPISNTFFPSYHFVLFVLSVSPLLVPFLFSYDFLQFISSSSSAIILSSIHLLLLLSCLLFLCSFFYAILFLFHSLLCSCSSHLFFFLICFPFHFIFNLSWLSLYSPSLLPHTSQQAHFRSTIRHFQSITPFSTHPPLFVCLCADPRRMPYNSFPCIIFNTRHLASTTSSCCLTQADVTVRGTQQITLFCSDLLAYGFTLTDR